MLCYQRVIFRVLCIEHASVLALYDVHAYATLTVHCRVDNTLQMNSATKTTSTTTNDATTKRNCLGALECETVYTARARTARFMGAHVRARARLCVYTRIRNLALSCGSTRTRVAGTQRSLAAAAAAAVW